MGIMRRTLDATNAEIMTRQDLCRPYEFSCIPDFNQSIDGTRHEFKGLVFIPIQRQNRSFVSPRTMLCRPTTRSFGGIPYRETLVFRTAAKLTRLVWMPYCSIDTRSVVGECLNGRPGLMWIIELGWRKSGS